MEATNYQDFLDFQSSLSGDLLYVWNHLNTDQQQLMCEIGADTFVRICEVFGGERIYIKE